MNDGRDPRADAAACDFLAMVERDRAAGTPRALADYQARFPGFAARIAQEWRGLGEPPPSSDPAPLRTLGRYVVLRELGRGGQAVVHLARDPELGRTVALKVLVSEPGWLSQARRDRLQREASALARLDHPGICTIYEARVDGDTPYLAMRYVAGEPLAARLRRARERPDPRPQVLLGALPDTGARIERVLAFGEEVARALHAAHTTGVLHRDVKPGNIMLDAEDRPVLLDFGLAQTDDVDEVALTRPGEIFGSIAYMAPERLAERRTEDQRSDVYSLGAVLYECFTLERPHAATTTETLLRAIVAGELRDPLRCNRALPRDLLLVLETALETDPARRYPSALALAEDLRRLRQHEPIAARPIGTFLRLRRWTRRHPVLAVALTLLLLALAVTSILLLQMAAQQRRLIAWQHVLEAMTQDEPTAALAAVLAAAPHVPERKLNGPLLQLLGRSPAVLEFDGARLGSEPGGAVFSADDRFLLVPTARGELVEVDARTGAVARRVQLHRPTPATSVRLDSTPSAFLLAVDPARAEAVTSSLDGTVRRWDLRTWRPLPLAAGVGDLNADVAAGAGPGQDIPWAPILQPSGRHLVLVGPTGGLLVADLQQSRCWRARAGGEWFAQQVGFRPGRDQVVVRWREYRQEYGASDVRVLDLATGSESVRLDLDGAESSAAAFDDAGDRLAVVAIDGVVRVFDAATWQCTDRLVAGGEEHRDLYWVSFADPHTLVTTGFEGLTVWDLRTRQRVASIAAPSQRPFDLAAWNADRTQLAVVVKDGTLRIYDAAVWNEIARAPWQYRFPHDLTWNRAGDRLAFQDGRALRVIAHQPPAPLLRPHRAAVVGVQFLGERELLTASQDGTAAITEPGTGRCAATFAHPAPVRSARATADGTRIVTACDDGCARVWPRAGGEPAVLAGHRDAVRDAWPFDRDRRVLTIGADGLACVFDAASGACQPLVRHAAACLSAAFAADLGLIATGGADRKVHVYDWQGELLRRIDTFFDDRRPIFDVEGNASAMVFDAGRHRLLVAHRSVTDTLLAIDVRDWSVQRIAAQPLRQGQTFSVHAAFVPGGRYYATAHSGVGDWTFVAADALTPRDLGQASMPNTIVSVMRFCPTDDRLLLVAARDGRINLWDLDAGERHLELRDAHDGVRCAEFSPDGRWVATGNQDGTLHVWPVHPLAMARAHHARLTGK